MGLFQSVLANTCPRCRRGSLFVKPYTLKSAYKMHDRCPNCGQTYEPEPGFYFGAMFLSYIISSLLLVAVALFLVFGLKWNVNLSIGIMILIGLLTHNFFYRLSRSLWIHMMVKYEKKN